MELLLSAVTPHAGLAPSPWVLRWTAALPPGARVLDLACGHGRHLRALAARGLQPVGVDRDAAAIDALRGTPGAAGVELCVADLEAGPWPWPGRVFDAVVVTNYLWRPLWPTLLASLAPGGRLVHETFAVGNESVGKPSNPDFLLRPGELLEVARDGGLRVLGYEDGFLDGPPRFVQRIAAVREQPGGTPTRHPLG